jgi:hypothetical protein
VAAFQHDRRRRQSGLFHPRPRRRLAAGDAARRRALHDHRARSQRRHQSARRPISAPLPRSPPAPPEDWGDWPRLLADRSGEIEAQINITPQGGFGTVCSSLLAISRAGEIVWRFAKGPPDVAPYEPVALAGEGVAA